MTWPLQIFSLRWRAFREAFRTPSRAGRLGADAVWRRDPLAHPALRTMSQRELGDLPFNRHSITGD
ncbi:hypothetical protein [Pelagibius sp. 7325]|uniref:hypothetical protein n=1 Tax=Pelagibius sp. 7325 TaxID=3131994 RepID=UPI0030EF344A